MIFALDMDGTICDVWYGEDGPDYFNNDYDTAVRSLTKCDYDKVRIIPGVLEFLENASKYFEGQKLPFSVVVVSTISNGQEYKQKEKMLDYFKFDNDKNIFSSVIGTVSNTDKNYVLDHLAKTEDVVYFDDSLSTVFQVRDYCVNNGINNVLPLHSSEIFCRSIEEILEALKKLKCNKKN